ncbi:protein NUCLEAR FUSION DEFECTIVE 6, mitochondrial isoform X3 [Eucalyptus grandis]|uniref:Uncharacterized protein n=2 Tax=Eucalyptus grandis TaxID=71139 RepID=A0ACC3ITG0_EUCGR|nr:protein NUCLEAR FUSION DEFECTIVE 6, mitochondrial isoform X2 [Eucalyptus grandis]XP_010035782.1 protein NUCLEAR FUSION DEFECTIVE 6, mitochondrial isoform X3 [Eucalyptus grandis]KAK3404741.1 hypothetical protein EUGRSUZ_K01049 [Eucalyptus grandis]
MASVAARSIFRSASARSAASRVASGAAKPARSAPRAAATNRPLSHRIFRSPVEMSACAETMLPYHTATSSALMTSMLSITRRSYGWLPDACNDDV